MVSFCVDGHFSWDETGTIKWNDMMWTVQMQEREREREQKMTNKQQQQQLANIVKQKQTPPESCNCKSSEQTI